MASSQREPMLQIRGMHALIRDQDISRHEFVFYLDRLIRLVVEHGLGHLPFTEKQVVTPTGSVYTGVDFCKKLCGVSIVRRKTWVYFLKKKSEVFSTFKMFKALVEKQSGYQIKAMRSDRDRKEVEKEPIEPATPSSPVSLTQSSPSSSSVDSPVKTGPQGKRSLEEIYNDLNQKQGMFYLFADTEPINFDEASRSEKLRKAMNEEIGAIQAPKAWNSRIYKHFQERGFKKCPHEHALYVKMNGQGDILIVCLYVDDLIFTGNCVKMIDDFKKEMAKEFIMTDISLMSYYLGIEVKQRDNGIFISQEAYAKEVLKRFNMENCKPNQYPHRG
ncbi:hypothetical protein RJ639_030676 [Escallonia herrerae]|uniref:Reverse transcriptase Ty1/copia-type domain-containing protein n=1 Tax=Escallonia herrerae TaxID=1293975 RepID=A0AA88X129_9ASTE|nr:hypothetical protein RJ639_030676 [Escallonia herrerae]